MDPNDTPIENQLSDSAVSDLWRHYGHRLRAIARRFLSAGRSLEDSEGIANEAFMSLIRIVSTDEPSREERDRDAIWPLAMGIARNKARMANRRAAAVSRGGQAKAESADNVADADVASRDPSLLVELEELMSKLDAYTTNTPLVRQIVERRLSGQTSKEIAIELGKSESMICRRLAELRKFLQEC